jgi:hypothetical protein
VLLLDVIAIAGALLLIFSVSCLPTVIRVMRIRRLERMFGKAHRQFICALDRVAVKSERERQEDRLVSR